MPFNSFFAWMMKKRIHQIKLFCKYPSEVQNDVFQNLINSGSKTEFGRLHNFRLIKNHRDFKQVPLQSYDSIRPWIDRSITGEKSVLWPTATKWFAKSSGTTNGRSKLIPVTKESLEECHYKGGKDLLALYYNNYPNRKLYKGKHLIIGGSSKINHLSADSYFGDLSAIIVKNLPWWVEIRRTPSRDITLMSDWTEKIQRMAESTINEDVYIIAGVPSWTNVLVNKVLEISGRRNLKEVWPNLELFMHGGVSFEPYRDQFKKLIPDLNMNYVETYNASEGFFGIQDQINSDEMLLMLDYGIYFEFIPMESFNDVKSKEVVSLKNIELGQNYAVVISTNGGLWRYILGDTIRFTSRSPYRFKITGRTKSYINCFGEELIIENTESAIAIACFKTGAEINEYTVAPIFMDSSNNGGHEWIVEFKKLPKEIERFILILDETLRELNSDYDAKRYNNLVLSKPVVNSVSKGTFNLWLKSIDKLGGQNKVPRLSNNRFFLEQIVKFSRNNNVYR